jgi:hypothetical protein
VSGSVFGAESGGTAAMTVPFMCPIVTARTIYYITTGYVTIVITGYM